MRNLRSTLYGAVFSAALISAGLALAQSADHHTGVDNTVRPADDFYGYANNSWLRATPLPAGVARLDTTAMLRAENARRVQHLIEDAVTATTGDSPHLAISQKVADFYSSWLDMAAIDARGLAPLANDLAAIAAIADRRALATYLGQTIRLDDGANQNTESLWGVWIHQGFHDPDHYAAHLVQGGLTLPQEDYLGAGSEHAARLGFYRTHIANVLRAAGLDHADARAARVVELELAIADTHASRADTDDVFKTDNTWRRADFAVNAPGFAWDAYFSAAGLEHAPSFVVWQPQSVIGGARLLATQPLEAWKDYLAFHLVEHYAAVLPRAIAEEQRAFVTSLSGAVAPPGPDRAQQAIAATQSALGDAIGQMYVARYFPSQAKAAATGMVDNIRAALRARLANVSWMSAETRSKALAKLAALRVGLGYPETWTDYARLAIVAGDAFGNVQRADAFSYRREVEKLRRRVDPDEWAGQLHPQMVSAILNLSPNSMQFAAGLLQPPYFDATGDAASNYGSAGVGIAHEISHSFDEVSNMYDARGRLVRWWSAEDVARYHAAIAPLAAQLDTCCPTPDACAHGAQIVAESAADLAGLTIAHGAYVRSLHGRLDEVINGLTGEQRFFVAFAQRWRRQQTAADLQRQIESDNHAPPQCRSDLVRNSEAWAQAVNARNGNQLYVEPEARVRLW